MVCSACGSANDAGRKFCRECGTRLAAGCPTCGASNGPGDRFCGECGAALDRPAPSAAGAPGAEPPADAEPVVTERRLVSVLFADLVGSTSFAEDRDPEDVRAMLTAYFEAASEAVERHGGVVEKFIGDAVMAVWGTPVAHEDDAERAVRAGLDVVDRVASLGLRLGVNLRARVGVLTGEAVATVGAVGQGLVAGDLVNTAARLQSAAEPGTVLVGEGTFRSASGAVAFAALDPLTVKGKRDPVPAWQALRVVSEVGGAGRGTGQESPFVGRDEELRLAKDLLHATGREGRPRLLSVTGVAGIGKSRLLWELRKYVDGLTEPIFWHQGRCPAYGEGVSFWALAEMVRGRAGIAETDDDDASRELLTACLADLVDDDDDERQWLEPRLAHLLGLGAAPPGGSEELFGAWRRFFERIAGRGTTVLAFEDLHWADPGLLDFVESLLAWSRTSPVLVVTLARPELADRRASWGAGVRSLSALHLEPLAAADIAALLTEYVDGLPEADTLRLVERAEGVPLYAVETVRMLADRGVLQPAGPGYRVVAELGPHWDVPETLHALVAARLDGLPDAERSLVLDAAVAGQSFTVAAVCAVTGRPSEDVEPRLRALVAKEVLDEDVDPRSAERGQFRFVQSVIQEVAYSTLSKAARRAKHMACATWLAGLDEDDLAGIVASHFLEAYRAEPAAEDAESVADQARDWLRRAADRAFSLGSPDAALHYAQQGLTLARTPEERAALHAAAGRGAAHTGQLTSAWEHLAAASDAYRSLDQADNEGSLLAQASNWQLEGQQMADLRERLSDVEHRLTRLGPARVLVHAAMAQLAIDDGRRDDALRWSESALVMAQTLADDTALGHAAGARAIALLNADRHWEAAVLSEGLTALAARSGSVQLQCGARMGLGVVVAPGDPRRALSEFLSAAETAAAAGIRPAQGLALANAAELAIDLGDLDVAAGALAEANELGTADRIDQDGGALCEALLAGYRGETAAARTILDDLAAERLREWSALQMTTWFLRTRSAVRLVDGDAAGALADARESLALEASGGNSSTALWQGVQAAARLGDADAVAAMLEVTVGLRGAWVDDVRRTAAAVMAGLRGDDGAAEAMGQVLRDWRARELPLDHALTAAMATRVLPPDLLPQVEVDQAVAYLRELRADGLLRLF